MAHAESELGEVLLDRGRYAEARELLERSVRNLQGEEAPLEAARARLARLDELARRGRARPGERARHATSRALPAPLSVRRSFSSSSKRYRRALCLLVVISSHSNCRRPVDPVDAEQTVH